MQVADNIAALPKNAYKTWYKILSKLFYEKKLTEAKRGFFATRSALLKAALLSATTLIISVNKKTISGYI